MEKFTAATYGTADPDDDLPAAIETAAPGSAGAGAVGQPATPHLALVGFSGPLDRLLALARAHAVDLAGLSLTDLVTQLATALRDAAPTTPLGQKGDWVVMAAGLVQLRSLLLLPVDAPARRQAEAAADQLRDRLVTLRAMQTLADWLERQPQLGRDVFARGRPEMLGVAADRPAADIVGFLWASLALFDAAPDLAATPLHRARPVDLHTVAAARDRILRRLAERPEGASLDQCLPDGPTRDERAGDHPLRGRSGWRYAGGRP